MLGHGFILRNPGIEGQSKSFIMSTPRGALQIGGKGTPYTRPAQNRLPFEL
jgi:hypothetical protein